MSIFSSKYGWRVFLHIFCVMLTSLFIGSYLFIVVVDPYDAIPFSPPWERAPVDRDQSYFYPSLARSARFDSAIIGTSSVRLLRPEDLNSKLNSRFVNLAMNAASVFEQDAILDVFLRHHPNPKTIIFGIDHVTFKEGAPPQHHSDDPSLWPEKLYDQNPYNNFPSFRLNTLEHAWRQFLYLTGFKTYKYGLDGYTDFTKPMDEYDLNRTRLKIYGRAKPKPIKSIEPPATMAPEALKAVKFPPLIGIERMLDKLPDDTLKILFVCPFHHYAQPRLGSKKEILWQAFLGQLVDLTQNRPRTYVLNFNIPSPITTKDSNYWDKIHYTVVVAPLLSTLIGEGINVDAANASFVRLTPLPGGHPPGRGGG